MFGKGAAVISILPLALGAYAVDTARFDPVVAERTVYGRVVDAGSGATLSDVQVIMRDTRVGSNSDTRGLFDLRGVPTSATNLILRHPCYFTVQVTIPSDGDVEISIGLPYNQKSVRDAGCGGLGARQGPPS